MKIALTIAAGVTFALTMGAAMAAPELNDKVAAYITERAKEFDQIPEQRIEDLQKQAAFMRQLILGNQPARLFFVCTHNSRRSQFAQTWCAAAAYYYDVPMVNAYSGGTESTACNPRAIAALKRAGVEVIETTDDENPIYHVRLCDDRPQLTLFSKVFSSAPNPKEKFCAVMVCSQADQLCPRVDGAALRLSIAYDDPKKSDDSPEEAATYDARCQQIAREMMYTMSLLKR